MRKTQKRNQEITSRLVEGKATSEHYSLFRQYIDYRHWDGGMADMSVLDFQSMIDETYVDTRIAEFRRGDELIAAALVDLLDDGISMIYSFYDIELAERSLGTFMILAMMDMARLMDLPYVYLGYWVEGSEKMDYKSKFIPQERLTKDGWRFFDPKA
jgi:arginine-tRNA-protein transferase